MSRITALLESIGRRRPHRTIWNTDEVGRQTKYLTRYELFRVGAVKVRLHQFHRGDEDDALHSHPWRWALSLMLVGGYIEERMTRKHRVRPGAVNFIRDSDFHRVDLVDGEAWSLFVTGPKTGTWYFWDKKLPGLWQWRTYLSLSGREPVRA